METEHIDKLFLELSQVTKAKTSNELYLENLLYIVLEAWKNNVMLCDGFPDGDYQLYNRAMKRINASFQPDPSLHEDFDDDGEIA